MGSWRRREDRRWHSCGWGLADGDSAGVGLRASLAPASFEGYLTEVLPRERGTQSAQGLGLMLQDKPILFLFWSGSRIASVGTANPHPPSIPGMSSVEGARQFTRGDRIACVHNNLCLHVQQQYKKHALGATRWTKKASPLEALEVNTRWVTPRRQVFSEEESAIVDIYASRQPCSSKSPRSIPDYGQRSFSHFQPREAN